MYNFLRRASYSSCLHEGNTAARVHAKKPLCFIWGGVMGVSDFRLRLHWPSYRASLDNLKPVRGLFRNFHAARIVKRMDEIHSVDWMNDSAPVISRSDGETFHLVLGDTDQSNIRTRSLWKI